MGITGSIPSEIGSIVPLEELDLTNTGVSGELPTELGSLFDLEIVYLQGTDITGNLNDLFCTATNDWTFLVSNCLGNEATVSCVCCTTCCDENGENCVS